MAIENPIISASSIERLKTRTVVVPTVYSLPTTDPALVTSSSTSVFVESTVTNYLISSESFTNSSNIWAVPSSGQINFFTYSADSVTSPIGTMTADRVTSNANYYPLYLRQYFSVANDLVNVTPYTFSIYLKVPSGSISNFKLSLKTSDLFAGETTIAQSPVTITTSWQRFSVTGTPPNSNKIMIEVGGENSWPLNTAVDMWGAQMEESSTMGQYVSTGNGTLATGTLPVSQTFTEYQVVSTAPIREGQMISYKNGDSRRLYVAVDIEGVITWKPCIGIAEYINPTTGNPPDSNILLYSSSNT